MNNDLILFICCVGGIVCIPSIIAGAVWGCAVLKVCNPDTAARDAEIDKQIVRLKTAQRKNARLEQRLERRIKKLEKLLGEK